MTSSVLAAFLLPLVVSSMAVDLPYFCGFEDPGLCGMEHREGGNFTWTRHNESTPSSGTGPEKAFEGGWYMYIESSDREPDNRVEGDKAYIQTPPVEYTGDVCIRFQYHMNGQHIGRLVVFVDTRAENSAAAFTMSGHLDTTWHRENVNVEGFTTGERVVFMAEVGGGFQGDIALDDLHIADGTCNDCQINNGDCQHICLPDKTWATCSCYEGYIKNGQRCILLTTIAPPKTSKGRSTSTSRSKSSTTNRPNTPTWTNTMSTVQRATTTMQPTSRTTSRVTGQQTEKTTGLKDQQNVTDGPGNSSSNADDRRTAYIAGGVPAGVVSVVGVVLLVICVIRKRRSGADKDGSPQPKTSIFLPLPFPKRGPKEQVASRGDDSEPVVTQREPKLSVRLSRLSLALTRILTAPKPTNASGQHDMEAASVTVAEPPPELLRKIPGEDFPSYVTGQNSKGALAQEFKGIPYRLHPCTEAVRPIHKTRNRFLNILPYDRNRVTLEQLGEEIESQYINASFIKMYREDEIFIASQGPTHATINDFWRMVWEQDVGLVVMLTKVEEGDKKRKCERYWPEEGSKSYGSFIVDNKSTVYWPDFILRTFAVAMRDNPDEWRYVKQLHFISWLDHVVPNDITTLLRFHRRMRRDMVAGKLTVIHCRLI